MTNQLKEKGKTFAWQEKHQYNFDKIKQALATTSILAIVNPKKPFKMETTASDKAINMVLLQKKANL